MSKLYNTSIDLGKSELQNARLQNLASNPSSPVVGQMYYATSGLQPLWFDGTSWKNVATDSAMLNGQNATYYLARANHTGTQLAATISDFGTSSQALINATRLDQLSAPTGPVSFGGQRITNVGPPTSGTDAVNKNYADNLIAAISWKDEVKTHTTSTEGNVVLASGAANGSTIAGYVLVTGDRFSLGGQTAGAENGIYVANATGAPTRASDADTASEIQGAAFYVSSGTNAGNRYVNNNTGAITLGTTSLSFASFGGGTAYTFGNGLTGTSNITVLADPVSGGGISVSSSGVKVDTAVVVRKYAQTFGDGSAVSYAITHGLGTLDVQVQVYIVATGATVEVDVTRTSTSVVTLAMTNAPASNAYRVIVQA